MDIKKYKLPEPLWQILGVTDYEVAPAEPYRFAIYKDLLAYARENGLDVLKVQYFVSKWASLDARFREKETSND